MRGLIFLIVAGALAYLALTVKLGDRTFAEHAVNIWASDEAQELVDGLEEESGPMLERIKRGVQAGVEEAARAPDADTDADANADADADANANGDKAVRAPDPSRAPDLRDDDPNDDGKAEGSEPSGVRERARGDAGGLREPAVGNAAAGREPAGGDPLGAGGDEGRGYVPGSARASRR